MSITCDLCGNDARDKVICTSCADGTCTECKGSFKELYCKNCAEDEFGEPEPETSDVNVDHLHDLAAAIRRGDQAEAEYLLDRVGDTEPKWRDAIELGRFSPKARRTA